MDDPLLDDSIYDVGGGSSDAFSPEPKPTKAKAAPKKAAIPKSKPAPKKMTQTTLKTTKAPPAKKRAKPASDNENSDVEMDSVHDDSLLSNDTPPSAKRQKTAPGPKKSSGKTLQPIENESFGLDGTQEAPKKAAKSGKAADQYQKLSHLEHILKRPDMYIGSVERTEKQMWVYNSQTDAMENREVNYVPGLYKIFDEILVNAADNKQRDKNMDEIKVTVDREAGHIAVRNNGRGIPVEIHSTEGIYVPEMIFGHLLAGSNYNDDEEKVVGGRNGLGAKLANIYSLEFTIDTADSKQKKRYKQTWTNNMSSMAKPKITDHKGDDFTQISFKPDFRKFGMDEMDHDFEALVKRRVYDMAGTCKDVKVYLNGERIKVRNFKKYMEMYTKSIKTESLIKEEEGEKKDTQVILTDNPHERWEIGFAVSDGSFQQVSFVNSIATTTGGTHVNFIADQIVNKLMEIVKKKNKGGVQLKPNQIRNHIFLFINCLIVNPSFSSQTKEQLTTKSSQFGSKPVVSDNFLKAIVKTEAVNNILHFAQQKADQAMKKSDGVKRTRMNHSKLTDANKAGTKDGSTCTLILTEGDSASLLALAGRAVLDPDLIGVFPLRGKLLNVRDASVESITKNQEIQNIKKFMGLQHKKVYEDTKSLRYGHLMIMTDQDHDGSHIKGLLINFLEYSFPSLLRIPGFLQQFITPIVKVWKGDPKNPRGLQSFFTMPEYEQWKRLPGNEKGWDHKYFKGLGTSSPSDAEIYFSDLDKHLKQFATIKAEEPAMIELAFSKKKADARKEWLRDFVPGTFLDMSTSEITYNDFINKELILFSIADNMRSIPSVVDGFKPGQRKVLYTCLRRNLKKDVKVVELAGSVSGLTAYAYGDTSLQMTIVGLAQTFVGSNNVNCLEPSGNFGSRLQGGDDCASARYIYTRLSPFARKVFNQTDEALLSYNTDDGKTIEPEVYVPVVPMILINGADGIGTGWSSTIPNFNPEDVVDNLRRRMKGSKDDMMPMMPWFRGWNGEVEDLGGGKFKFSGKIQYNENTNDVEITELPIRVWTQDFKDKLEEIIKAEKTPSIIKDYTEYNTPVKVHFIIKMEDKHLKVAIDRGLDETFKLHKTLGTTNLVAFDSQNRIHKYATVLDMLEEFFQVRLKYYQKRKEYLRNLMTQDLEKLNNQARFIKMIIDNELIVYRKKKTVLIAELKSKGFKPIPKVIDAQKEGEFEKAVEDNDDAEDADTTEGETIGGLHDYDYLLGMPIWSLTQERIDKLMKQIGDKEVELNTLINTSPQQLWETDLDDFIAEWRFQLEDEARRAKKLASKGRRASAKLGLRGKAASKKRKANEGEDSDFEVSKSKKAAAAATKAKQSALLGPLAMDTSKPQPPKPTAAQALMNVFEESPVAKPPAERQGLLLDGASDPVSEAEDGNGKKIPSMFKKASTTAGTKPPQRVKKQVFSDDDEDDVFAEVANEAISKGADKLTTQPGRTARNARKPIKYNDSDDSDSSDNGDEFLGDVGNMVKGIPKGNGNTNGAPKTLFSASASVSRPSSSSNSKALKSYPVSDNDDDVDMTDYKSLVPKGSPEKPAARNARDVIVSDDEDDSLIARIPKAALKSSSTLATKVGPTKLKQSSTKVVDTETGKQATTATVLKEKKPAVLSPAAKAYAAKQAKAKPTTAAPSQPKFEEKAVMPGKLKAKAKAPAKKVISDDEDDDVDDIVNEILSEDDDLVKPSKKLNAKSAGSKPKPEPAARPSRRAAAAAPAKSNYVIDDDDDDEGDEDSGVSSEEPSYNDDDSD